MDSSVNPYGGRGPIFVKFTWSMIGIYTVLLALRTYVYFKLVRDGALASLLLAYLAYFWGIAAAGVDTYQMLTGVGNHLSIVEAAGTDLVKLKALQWVFHAVMTTAFPIARFSVLAFLLSIQGRTNRIHRRILIGINVIGLLLGWVGVATIYAQCSPPSRLWDPSVPGVCPPGRADANDGIATTQGVWGAITDICLALYPIYLVHGLQMRTSVKIGISCLMGLGLFSAVCAIVRTFGLQVAKSTNAGNNDFTYQEGFADTWGSAELWVILITSAVPALWPLVKLAYTKIQSQRFPGQKAKSLIGSFNTRFRRSSRGQSGIKSVGGATPAIRPTLDKPPIGRQSFQSFQRLTEPSRPASHEVWDEEMELSTTSVNATAKT